MEDGMSYTEVLLAKQQELEKMIVRLDIQAQQIRMDEVDPSKVKEYISTPPQRARATEL